MEQTLSRTSSIQKTPEMITPDAVWNYLKNYGKSQKNEVWSNQLESMSFSANNNLQRKLNRMPTLHERPPQARSFHSRFHKNTGPRVREEKPAPTPEPIERGNRGGGGGGAGDGSWRTVRRRNSPKQPVHRTTFKTEAKDENEKHFMDIRGLLNKITRANAEAITDKIRDKFIALNDTYRMRVFKTIHDNVSKQVIFVDQQRQILEALVNISPEIRTVLQKFYSHFSSIQEIRKKMEDVDYREDQDAFCDLNEMKARRKGLSEFFGICMTVGLGDPETQRQTIEKLLGIVKTATAEIGETPSLKPDLEERVDCLQAIVKPFQELKDKDAQFDDTQTHVKTELQGLLGEFRKQIPSKGRFKMMDIVEGRFN